MDGLCYKRVIFVDGCLKINQALVKGNQLVKIFITGGTGDLYLQVFDDAIDFPQMMNKTLRQFP